ncbi:hypothetical protein CK203_092987 [Vitis vinifera]|uniref:Uncharacterized protein n=1 Tax=Vitis vinifera TaxID=29760 RepID=A0A438DFS2_VITVI|nr:hypothetical protein CK203_092987 [Vitis vinifera]
MQSLNRFRCLSLASPCFRWLASRGSCRKLFIGGIPLVLYACESINWGKGHDHSYNARIFQPHPEYRHNMGVGGGYEILVGSELS